MNHRATSAAGLLLVATLAACTPTPITVDDRFPAMGTLVDVTLRVENGLDHAAIFRSVRSMVEQADHEWSAWGDGALGAYNAGARPADEKLQPLLERAAVLERSSGGLFNPAVGALTELWGFHGPERERVPPPDQATIRRWLDDNHSLAAGTGGELLPVRIDMGAFAKGVVLHDIASMLVAAGVEHALVNAGGDIVVLGDAGGRPWRIGIRDPRGVGVFAGVTLAAGEAIFTSGDYERVFEWDSQRYHHILDPRTGRPATGTASFTVIHRDPALADAAATALFVAGDDWVSVAGRMGVSEAMRVTAEGRIQLTGFMAARVRFERPETEVEVVDAPGPSR